ncbi:hypothetical protein BJY04DRAFT_219422 [Aspergillus karnatakaensis]|uniref:sulfotransferase family protein n=1 Tax=Aspergillus karnatakaensis TaxID=1810916 RepID=UPI003CCD1410
MGQQPSSPRPGKTIQVIGAGLPRTGTASFSAALEILLDGPAYHCGTQVTIGAPIEIKSWIRIVKLLLANTSETRELALTTLQARLTGYAAITDAPGCQLVTELLALYPDALVICTKRDLDAWEKSMDQISRLFTVWFLRAALLPLPGLRHFAEYTDVVGKKWVRLYGQMWPPVVVHNKHVEWLKEVVPEDRLVFLDVKDGWEPLCQALGKDVPRDIPFPRINDSKAFEETARYHLQRAFARWAVIVALTGFITFWLFAK